MNCVFGYRVVVGTLALALAADAVAADLGELRGNVIDAEGLGVPGVQITLRGERLPHERYTTTDDLGRFRIRDVPPGEFQLLTVHATAPDVLANVVVRAARTTDVPITLAIGGSDGAIFIIDTEPVLDMTTSSVSTALGRRTLQDLPVPRDFLAAAETLPGVSAQFGTAPSARGEGALGNSFRIDGIITRDPGDHSLAQTVPFDAIQELQVYTDGAPAEFGPFTGMLLNVVTQSGGDEHRGSLAAFYAQHASSRGEPTQPVPGQLAGNSRRRFWEPTLAFNAGGPAVPDKLWYFTAFEIGHRSVRPEGLETLESTFRLQGLVKLSWAINERVTMRYVSTVAPSRTSDAFTGEPVTDGARPDTKGLSQSHLLELEFGLSGHTLIETRFGYTHRINVVESGAGQLLTPSLVSEDGVLFGNVRNESARRSGRLGGAVVVTRYIDNFLGSHRIRAGADAWLLSFSERVTHSGQTERAWIDGQGDVDPDDVREVGTEFGATPGFPCTLLDGSDCGVRLSRHSPGRLRNRVSTWSFFVQDDWEPVSDLNLNLGFRVDVEDGRNNAGRSPSGLTSRVMPAPRLGVAYNLLGREKTKLFANYGRYYDLAGAPFWGSSNTRSPDSVIVEQRSDDGEFEWVQTNDPVKERRYNLGIEHTDRLVLGVSQRLGSQVVGSVRLIRAATRGIPQETRQADGTVLVQSGRYERNYSAAELAIYRAFQNDWVAYGSYTLGSSRGHVDNQLSPIPLGIDQPYGPLASDIRHQLRLNGAWTAPFGSTFGAVYAFNSGRAYSRRTYIDPFGFVGYAGGRGTERTDATHRVDLRAGHTLPLGSDNSLEFTLDLFNVIGSEVPLLVVDTDTQAFGTPIVRQEPRSVRLGARLRW